MLVGSLVAIAVLGGIVLAVAGLVTRRTAPLEITPRGLLRGYLYLASLAGVIVLVIGLAAALNAGLAAVAGNELVYGRQPIPAVAPCPPNAPPECFSAPRRFTDQSDRRRAEDAIRGATFTVFGGLFWLAHRLARRGNAGPAESQSALGRGYLMLGTVVFGLTTVILLPTGIYQMLSNALLPPAEFQYVPGISDSLAGGVVSLPVWLIYLRLVVRDFRSAA